MSSPKSLVLHLYRHWEVIEYLCRLSRELPAFETARIMMVIERFSSQPEKQQPADVLRSLCTADILQPLSRSDDLQLNPLVIEFVRGLTREHELGLSAVLKARVDAVNFAASQMAEGIELRDMDRLLGGAAKLSELFRQIKQQLDQDRHAILDLAEKAKANEASMPAARRYRAVLDAYDQYIEPMNEMMDSGPSGTFYHHLDTAVQTLDRAEEHLATRGSLYTQRLQLRQVAHQAKELRRLGRVVAQQCADTLLPLREEVRQHNVLSSTISELLGQVRKRGLKHVLRKTSATIDLPSWHRERRTHLHLGSEISTLMAQAMHFEPQLQAFPHELSAPPEETAIRIDERQLRIQLKAALPVSNLMLWLRQHFAEQPDATLLRLYHDLVRETDWQADIQPMQVDTDLQKVRVTYQPHQLQPLVSIKERSGND